MQPVNQNLEGARMRPVNPNVEGARDVESVENDEHDVQQELRIGHHDPTAIPDCMQSADGHTQEDLHDVLYTTSDDGVGDHLVRFREVAIKRTKLSTLQRIVEREDHKSATSLLQKRRVIEVDDEFLLDLKQPDVVSRTGPHFVDFTLYVGDKIGLGPVLPLREHDPTWSMQLSFNHTTDLFPRADVRYLPFNPMGRMFKVGTRLQETMWLAMVPTSYLDRGHPDNIPGHYPKLSAATSVLDRKHSLMVTMFFAFALTEMRFRDLHCVDRYPDPLTRESVNQSTEILDVFDCGYRSMRYNTVVGLLVQLSVLHDTAHVRIVHIFVPNIMSDIAQCGDMYFARHDTHLDLGHIGEQKRTLILTLPECRDLDDKTRTLWNRWVRRVPDSWKVDGFITSNIPIFVTMVYGQNQEICSHPDHADDERDVYNMDHDYSVIRQFTFSTASLHRYYLVTDWRNRDVDQILRKHNRIYSQTLEDDLFDEREQVEDLHNLDLLDEDGYEINIYDDEGFRIPRRHPTQVTSHGLWYDLHRAHELFTDDNVEFDAPRRTPFSAYPQAFLKKFGNLQSKSPPVVYNHMVTTLNAEIALPFQRPDDDDDDDDDVNIAHTLAIEPVAFQGYNEISHRFRDQARFHVTQIGLMTSAMAGSTCTRQSNIRKWKHRLHTCRDKLPHLRFQDKINEGSQPQALRNEVTFTLHLHRMKPEFRNGAAIYDRIISRVVKLWTHPLVLNVLKRCVVAFKFNLIPKIYSWCTFPVTCLLENLWQTVQPVFEKPGRCTTAYVIEMVAMLERVLNFGHTGNAQVLVKRLMDRAWLSLGLLMDGFPCISPDFIAYETLGTKTVIPVKNKWPVDPCTRRPLTASKRVQQLTYGDLHYECYEARFTIMNGIKHLTQDIYPHLPNNVMRRACFAVELGLRSYLADVKNLIRTGVMAEIRDDLSSRNADTRTLALERKSALETWLDQDLPLASSDASLPFLLRALYPRVTGEPSLTYSSIGKQSPSWFTDLIMKQCVDTKSRQSPPFIKDGTARSVLVFSVIEAKKTAELGGIAPSDIHKYISQCIIFICNHLRISHIPWVCNTPPGQRRSSTVIFNVWVSLSAASSQSNHARVIVPESSDTRIARTSQQMILDDPNGQWKALEVQLSDFATILHKRTPPVEFDINYAALNQSPSTEVQEIYNHVFTVYDGTRPMHQLALFCAIIFAGLAPNVHPPPKTHERPPADPASLRAYVRNLDWHERRSKKGSEMRGIHSHGVAMDFEHVYRTFQIPHEMCGIILTVFLWI
ncbi:hypothetical protein L210DRAFT_931249 [Boletus edulis BED1]|uniref:DUF8190 domain-containing protein n=1 Tax=Boletus edulis BED1 TaxID=1328754 RepID=A0AAD4BE36_BOLED|nr:hypothetical protein L210DRAFT_931249 [Boletus edulis BED1]